jgi:hypothetical protein
MSGENNNNTGEPTPQVNVQTPPQAPPPAAAPPAAAPPEILTLPKATFDDRLNRAKNSAQKKLLEQFGFNTIEEMEAWKKSHDKVAEEAEQKRLQELSEVERAKELAAKAEQEKQIAEQQYQQVLQEKEDAEIRAQVIRVCAAKNIKNVDYAMYKLSIACANLPGEDDVLDENEYLDKLLADPQEKAALGIETKHTPANTSTTDAPPPKADGRDMTVDATALSDEDWQKHKQTYGLS